jgi:hypothetical protein
VDLEYDEIIQDPYFAAILNSDREVVVADEIFKYTDKGLFYTSIENYDEINRTVANVNLCDVRSVAGGEVQLSTNVKAFLPAKTIDPNSDCDDDYCYGCGDGCRTCGTGGGSTTRTREDIIANLKVCEYNEGALNKLFGPSEKCKDYFHDKKRIKVKTWAQNYYVFASTGLSVKSQVKKLGIWWRSKVEELELGYSAASFKYNGIGTYPSGGSKWAEPINFNYEIDGHTIDQFGRTITGGSKVKELFTNFPVENDASVAIIYMFKPFSDIVGTYNLEITGKDFNKAVQTIAKTAYKTLSNSLKKEFSSKKATLVFPDEDWNNLVFVYANWSKIDHSSSKISEVFDWSTAQIGIKINHEVSVNYYSQPKKPSSFQIACYGMGLEKNVWKGGKIILTN